MERDRYLEVSGTRLRYQDTGAGHAVMLIHGWTLDLDMWEPQVSALSGNYRVIRFDRRGSGLSSGEPGIAEDAQDVQALCGHLDVKRCAFVGMSRGARVLERLAAVAPALISCLVFDGAPDMREGDPLTSNDVPLAEYSGIARSQGMEAFRRQWATHPLTRLVTDDPKMHALLERMLARYQGNDLVTPPGVAAGRSFVLSSVRVPVLVINGELDLDSRRQAGALLAQLIPGAEQAVIPHAGHLSNLDNSVSYTDTLLQFLARALAPRA